ncbi:MAG: AAA domain-containing protein [Bacteroidia bacterium]
MQQILHTYKLRLTNLSQGNRALRLGKLSLRRDADLFEWGFLENESPEALFQKILAGKNLRILNKLDARHEKSNALDKQLNLLYREILKIEEETGTYNLFIAYPFVEGKFADGTIARCPLLLFPVKLVRNLQSRPRWSLEVDDDAEIQWNQTFFLGYEQYQKVRIKPEFWEEKLAYTEDWQTFLNQLYEIFTKYELEIDFNSELFTQKLARFTDYLKGTMEDFPLGKLKLQANVVLGLFPQSDSALLQDYEAIEKANETYFSHPILTENARFQSLNKASFVPESNLFYVTSLDPSQENVLLKAKEGKSLVVHGPPGTGKSQVIVNLIADAMMSGKKVLVVSQKRAALDVVYKRLSAVGLSDFSVLVHDYQLDRSHIFQKIRQQIEKIEAFQQQLQRGDFSHTASQFQLLSYRADEYNQEFEGLYQALTQPQRCGLRLHDLYLSCDIHSEHFPLGEIARQWTDAKWSLFLPKLAQILDYASFYETHYTWKYRLSFHHVTYQEKTRLLENIKQLAPDIQSLKEKYDHLLPKLGDENLNLLHLPDLAECISEVETVRESLQNIHAFRWISAIYKDEWIEKELQEKLTTITHHFEHLTNCKFIKVISWSSALDLLHHIKVYEAEKNNSFRFLSFSYHKAVNFINKVLKMNQVAWNEFTYFQLQKEAQVFQITWQDYTDTHESLFFQDFPIENIFQGGLAWVEKKQEQFAKWQFIENLTFAKRLAPQFPFGDLNKEKWAESLTILQATQQFHAELNETLNRWNRFLHEVQIEKLQQLISQDYPTTNEGETLLLEMRGGKAVYLSQLSATLAQDFEELKTLDTFLAQLSPLEQETLALLEPEIMEKVNDLEDIRLVVKQNAQKQFIEKLKNTLYFYWINEIEQEKPEALSVSTRGWQRKAAEFSDLLGQKQQKTAEYIVMALQKQIAESVQYNRNSQPVTYRDLLYQTSKKRQLWSVRKLVQSYWDQGLNTLMPCWLASPESVAAIFQMQPDEFDCVIFDEASQCFVEKAIPVLLRGKQAIIAGDAKQLPPFDMYSVRYEEIEQAFSDNEILLGAQSILDLAKTNFESAYLTWHYRSQEKELINFSNYAFYEGRLEMLPSSQEKSENHPALAWISVNGLWKNNQNLPEAERVLALILELIQRKDAPSIGVVTFNFHQQELIKDLIDKKLEELGVIDPELFSLLQATIQRKQNGEFVGLFVKNIENVQGDERDVMIFSVGYAHTEEGKLMTNFGLLNQQGGENRLNVAITRAKKKIYVVCSFNPVELTVESAKNTGPKLLKDYLQYVKYVSEDRLGAANSLLSANFQLNFSPASNKIADEIAKTLQEKGFFVMRNVGDTQYKVDLAVKATENAPDFLLGIECEGSHYFSGVSAKEREIYRPELLMNKGWEMHRVHARNFWISKEKEIEKILALLTAKGG